MDMHAWAKDPLAAGARALASGQQAANGAYGHAVSSGGFPRGMSNKEWSRFQEFHAGQQQYENDRYNAVLADQRQDAETAHARHLEVLGEQGRQERLNASAQARHAKTLAEVEHGHNAAMADQHHRQTLETLQLMGGMGDGVAASWGPGTGTFSRQPKVGGDKDED